MLGRPDHMMWGVWMRGVFLTPGTTCDVPYSPTPSLVLGQPDHMMWGSSFFRNIFQGGEGQTYILRNRGGSRL